MVWKADIYIHSFSGLFDLYNLPIWISYIFSILVLIFIINAYNIIDGIDGLSSVIGILALIIYFVIFMFNKNYFDSLLSLSVMGSLFGFWLQNKPPANIFMGDSGSLAIGLLLAYFSIKISMLPLDLQGNINPVFAMVVLAYPVIDTLRVFTIRIYNGHSPFRADRKHIHHKLLDLGLSHGKSTAIIISFNICLVIISYMLRANSTLSYFIMVPLIILIAQIPFNLVSEYKIKI
jgi:UDP-N-acetylmuramyl pentapeptide phosphotransferase/UDP-N-acetylglucosamine-1-phosphate transferase